MKQLIDTNSLISCLDIIGEPVFILDTKSGEVSGNRSFLSLIGEGAGCIALQKFWPGFLESEIKSEACVSKFRIHSDEFVTVKLYVKEIEAQVYLIRVITTRLPHDTDQGFHQQRREMLGALAGGIAHDINNIVTGVLGHSAYLKMILPKTGPHLDSISAIEEGGNRSAQLSRQILSFIKQDSSTELVKLDLKHIIEGTCNLLRGAISKKLKLICELPPQQIHVKGVESQLSQVLVNLIVNARDSLRTSGEIRVVVRELETNEVIDPIGEVTGSERLKGKYACISVIDNGQGIPTDVIGRVFEPYFSTKSDKGTGLGLSTVKEIVERFAGVIEISSKSGIGTKVSVYLPTMDDNISKKAAPNDLDIVGGTERILVVDDEQSIRNVLSLSLRRLGYEVEIAASGSEAISKFIACKYNYDLIILDMVMPELSGRDIFFKLKEYDPHVAVLVCSAYASEKAIRDILDNGGRGFIQKPFDVEELAERIRDCLSSRNGQ